MSSNDLVDLVDDSDRVIGVARRFKCHGNPELIHRAVHVLLFNDRQQLLLQKRATSKDIQPGKWDTSVGGHLDPGESYRSAAVREMFEELGVQGVPLTQLYSSKIRNQIESENILTFLTIYSGPIFLLRMKSMRSVFGQRLRLWPRLAAVVLPRTLKMSGNFLTPGSGVIKAHRWSGLSAPETVLLICFAAWSKILQISNNDRWAGRLFICKTFHHMLETQPATAGDASYEADLAGLRASSSAG